MTAELHYLPMTGIGAPPIPSDAYAAQLEAKIIQLCSGAMAENAGSSVLAMAFAQALVIYKHHVARSTSPLDSSIAAGNYVRKIEAYLRSLPPQALTALRHPAIGRDRQRQQAIFIRAAAAANRDLEATDG